MLIQFALTLTVLLGFCGLALDVGMMELTQLKLQNAADAAALGAILPLGKGLAKATWQAAGKADSANNGFTDGQSNATVTVDTPATGVYANNPLAVQATITQQVTPIFFAGSRTLSATSTAMAAVNGCMYLLSQVFTSAPSLDATNQTVSNTCASYFGIGYVLTNATNGQFFVASDNTKSVGSVTPAPIFPVPQQPDPLSYLPAVVAGACTPANTPVTLNPNTNTSLSPGTYCGTLTIGAVNSSSNAIVTFSPGLYIIVGSLVVDHATLRLSNTAGGLTFYLTQNGTYPAGANSIQNSTVNLSAPATGGAAGLEGILFYADRGLPSNQQELTFKYNDSSSTYDGIFYLPRQGLQIVSQTFAGNQYTGIVADYLAMHNTGLAMTANYSMLADGNPFHPAGGGLVQ